MASPTTAAAPVTNPAASTSALAAQTQAQTDIPSEYVPRDQTGAVNPAEIVTITHGYGRVPPGWRNFIDRTLFVGGVARTVPYSRVQEIRTKAPGTILYTFKHDATEADFARVCGLSPELLDPLKQAALLSAMVPAEIVSVMGRESVVALCEKLLAAVGDTRVRPGNARNRTGR